MFAKAHPPLPVARPFLRHLIPHSAAQKIYCADWFEILVPSEYQYVLCEELASRARADSSVVRD